MVNFNAPAPQAGADVPVVCWSCCEPTPADQVVTLDLGTQIPSCLTCWKRMSPAERILVANTVMHSLSSMNLLNNTNDIVEVVAEEVRKMQGVPLPGWMKGGSQN